MDAEAVALGAGAVVGVEGEGARLELGHVDAAVGAGHGGREEGLFVISRPGLLQADQDEAVGHRESRRDGGSAGAGVVLERDAWRARRCVAAGSDRQRLEDDAVDDGFDRVVLALLRAACLRRARSSRRRCGRGSPSCRALRALRGTRLCGRAPSARAR